MREELFICIKKSNKPYLHLNIGLNIFIYQFFIDIDSELTYF